MRSSILLLVVFIVSCVPLQSIETQVVVPTLSKTPVPSKTLVTTLADTSTPTITPVLTFTPSPTSTPQPPLVAHEWNPETVLISMRKSLGDGGMSLGDLGPPLFILYADGSLFVTQYVPLYKTRVLVKKLRREEVCQHLNKLDQAGYLDYDSSTYTFIGGDQLIIGGPSTYIEVNAWKSKYDWYSSLSLYLGEEIRYYGQEGYPIISPALRDTYYFLYQYPTDGFEAYKPDRLAVWLLSVEKRYLDAYSLQVKNWKFKEIPLTQLIDKADLLPDRKDLRLIILSGQDARLLYDYFDNLISSDFFFTEDPKSGRNYYQILVRPLLPYETPGEYYTGYMSTIPAPDAPKPNFKLICYPSDGVLPIPTPPSP